jgi:Spx/MgsR family transcriptional regulator
MIVVYGLKNCDTCRKALKWLDAEGLEHRFHDVRADGLDAPTLQTWVDELGWETLLNRRGTTWRKLPAAETEGVDAAGAVKLMLNHPALIKRPVFALGDRHLVGFKAEQQDALRQAA